MPLWCVESAYFCTENFKKKFKMKKTQVVISFLMMANMVFAQKVETVTLRCKLDNCSVTDSLRVYRSEGLFQSFVTSAMADKNGEFVVQVPKSKTPQYYTVGVNVEQVRLKLVLLGTENEVILTGPCFDPSQTTVSKSKINESLADAQNKMNAMKVDMGKIMAVYNRDFYTDSIRIACEKQMLAVDKKKIALLDSLKKANPMAARIVALDTYTSFQNSPKKAQFKGEIEYFGSQYFQHVNFADAEYNEVPVVFNAVRDFTTVLTMRELGLTRPQIKQYLNDALKTIPAKSKTARYALTGAISVFLAQQNPLIVDFGSRFITEFPNDDPNLLAQISQVMGQMKSSMTDVPATEIAQADTANVVRKLSDLKGKVVLIDFWASWCGPCRRENPAVVALYNKYKAKGFEVFSVSLDQDRQKWIDAIAKDGLVWSNHVSDLRGWGNAAAQLYGVSSIPKTVLIDKNGIVTDHNLRGELLEKRLKEIFGE
jgi:thiol-disulfide isomerase/thioredoxin